MAVKNCGIFLGLNDIEKNKFHRLFCHVHWIEKKLGQSVKINKTEFSQGRAKVHHFLKHVIV